jgi:hypothetical protein
VQQYLPVEFIPQPKILGFIPLKFVIKKAMGFSPTAF